MEGMIWNANHVLYQALSPDTPVSCFFDFGQVERQMRTKYYYFKRYKLQGIPRGMIKNCKGIILLSVVEAGFIFSGNVCTGVIIANKYDGTWSPPSALGLGGIGW